MDLKAIIVHKINKEAQGIASLTFRQTLLPVTDRETEFITNVKKVYYNKSNPNYGVFDANTVAYPFQTTLRNYLDGGIEFLPFTVIAMNQLLAIINAVTQATGGYVVFAHYTLQNESFVMTVMLNDKKQYNINDDLSINEIFSLDIEKLDVANSINITRWETAQDTYLSFARGRKDVSNYFRRFIGCTDQTSAKQSSELLKGALLDYIAELQLDNAGKEEIRNRVFNYCITKSKRKEEISLNHISSMIDAENPDLFREFASGEDYRVSPFVKGHTKTLKTLKFYVYRSKTLSIEFDSDLINDTIFYNEDRNELKIKNVPAELKKQLINQDTDEE